jgi:hypothetical protein
MMVGAASALRLDGADWRFQFERGDKPGYTAQAGPIVVPGAFEAQGYGVETPNMRSSNGQGLSQRALEPGQPLQLHAVGNFTRSFSVPASWGRGAADDDSSGGVHVVLRVERVHRSATVLLDGAHIGSIDNDLVPFESDPLPASVLGGGPHTLTLLVDGWYDPERNNFWGCADQLDTSGGGYAGGWSGISGHVDLLLRGSSWLESGSLRVTPALTVGKWSIDVSIEVAGKSSAGATVELAVTEQSGAAVATARASVASGAAKASIDIANGTAWTTDTPHLYHLRATLRANGGDAGPAERLWSTFGLRTLRTSGPRFLLNNKPLFLRGFGDDATDYIFRGKPHVSCWNLGCSDGLSNDRVDRPDAPRHQGRLQTEARAGQRARLQLRAAALAGPHAGVRGAGG